MLFTKNKLLILRSEKLFKTFIVRYIVYNKKENPVFPSLYLIRAFTNSKNSKASSSCVQLISKQRFFQRVDPFITTNFGMENFPPIQSKSFIKKHHERKKNPGRLILNRLC